MRPVKPIVPSLKLPVTEYAKDQPEYNRLPVFRSMCGVVLSRWQLTWRERLRVLISGDVYLSVHTFNHPLQPTMLTTEEPTERSIAEMDSPYRAAEAGLGSPISSIEFHANASKSNDPSAKYVGRAVALIVAALLGVISLAGISRANERYVGYRIADLRAGSVAAQGDQTAILQAAIVAAEAVNGTVRLPSGTLNISATLIVTKPITIAGEGVQPVYGSIDDDTQCYATTLPIRSPYLSGTVIMQTTPGIDAIRIVTQGGAVNLRDFGIRFADPIAFRTTGHGVSTIPPNMSDGKPDWGIISAKLDSVCVFGTDGNHYAFRLVNPSLLTLINLHTWGGGGLETFADSNITAPGNSTIIECFFVTLAGGTSHGIYQHKSGATPGVVLMQYIRPQASVIGVPAVYGSVFPGITPVNIANQRIVNFAEGSHYLSLISPDFESNIGATAAINVNEYGFFMTPGYISGRASRGELFTNYFYVTTDGLRLLNFSYGIGAALLHAGGNAYLDAQGHQYFRSQAGDNRAVLTSSGDLSLMKSGTGLILRDSDGAGCHRFRVNSSGAISAEVVPCP